MFTSPGEIAFHVGKISVYYYGIFMAVALCVGIFVARLIVKKLYPELNPDSIYDLSPVVILCAIACARLYYCILCWGYYSRHALEIFQVWQGGLSIHGAIIGGLLGGIIYCKRHQLPILKLCDVFSYALCIGQSIGRWGNFFNSEAFGLPANNFLKLYIPIDKRPLAYMQYNYFHPTFLYESILDVCIFLILFFVVRKFAKKIDGVLFFTYLLLYSAVRIIIEHIRIDSVLNILGLPVAQFVSIIIILVSLIALFILIKRNRVSGN